MPKIDLILWQASPCSHATYWTIGTVHVLPSSIQHASEHLNYVASAASADFLLFWGLDTPPPNHGILTRLIATEGDIYHSGLALGFGSLFPDLFSVRRDWSMIIAPTNTPSTSWRLSLDACLVRRQALRHIGTLDPAFVSRSAAGVELGLRALNLGAIIEHRPELLSYPAPKLEQQPPVQDLYTLILRHYGRKWLYYTALRRSIRNLRPRQEYQALRATQKACAETPPPTRQASNYARGTSPSAKILPQNAAVSVIIPTLGRYKYIPGALESLRQQTVKPLEVIVIDQNTANERILSVYQGYEDLNLQVIWQDQRGQSLARNTGLAVARGDYVYFFDDDSIAQSDVIEVHLRAVQNGTIDVSTGVSYPPPPTDYMLPQKFRHPRLSQTLDTGNCLMPLSLARQIGGLDRNYDFGTGTDMDFGTRLYLNGKRILHNPAAIRIHFKAPIGGLRTFDAHKYSTDRSLLAPYPAATQSYYGLLYLSPAQRRERMLLMFITSHLGRAKQITKQSPMNAIPLLCDFCVRLLLLPLKWYRSQSAAITMIKGGVRTTSFPSNTPTESML